MSDRMLKGLFRGFLIAKRLQELDIDAEIEAIECVSLRLCAINLQAVTKLCNDVSDVVEKSTKRSGVVFASKLLHFSAPDLFPPLDSNAERKLKDIFIELDDESNKRIYELEIGKIRCNRLLDLWWGKYPEEYDKHHKKDMLGSELLKILKTNYPDHYSKLLDKESHDRSVKRYERYATDVLCLQQAICLDGGPMYSFRELDECLYPTR